MQVYTTLDPAAQRAAEEELARQLQAIEAGALGAFRQPTWAAARRRASEQTDYLQGAAVAIEVGTGDVLAWVGGRDFRHSHFDRVRQARRQPGQRVQALRLRGGAGARVAR